MSIFEGEGKLLGKVCTGNLRVRRLIVLLVNYSLAKQKNTNNGGKNTQQRGVVRRVDNFSKVVYPSYGASDHYYRIKQKSAPDLFRDALYCKGGQARLADINNPYPCHHLAWEA